MSTATSPTLRVSEIWRFPVKSMGGEQLSSAEITPHGIPFDRGWAVRDDKADTIRSARYIPRLLMCSARYLPGTSAGLVPHVEITLPDGSTVTSEDPAVHERLSSAIGRPVSLFSLNEASNPDFMRVKTSAMETESMEAEMRLIFGLNEDEPLTDLSTFPPEILQELAQFAAPLGSYFDAFPMSVLTTSSIRHLQSFVPEEDLSTRRFRANLIIDDGGLQQGRIESNWVGGQVRVGGAELHIVMDIPRCTIIAAEQPGLRKNSQITRTVVRELGQTIGVYCEVVAGGAVRVGDELAA